MGAVRLPETLAGSCLPPCVVGPGDGEAETLEQYQLTERAWILGAELSPGEMIPRKAMRKGSLFEDVCSDIGLQKNGCPTLRGGCSMSRALAFPHNPDADVAAAGRSDHCLCCSYSCVTGWTRTAHCTAGGKGAVSPAAASALGSAGGSAGLRVSGDGVSVLELLAPGSHT